MALFLKIWGFYAPGVRGTTGNKKITAQNSDRIIWSIVIA